MRRRPVAQGATRRDGRRFIVYRLRGQRFHGVGLGAATDGVRIDLYGSNGDYTASGMDGLEMHIHGNAQDQVAQIAKRGKLVIYGDVGQTFMYGAKGGEVFVLGNGAGRPLINAVGRPRVVINGTCLDFLAESFMAGDPLAGGGFVILNGIEFDADGGIVPQAVALPGQQPVLAGQRRRHLPARPATTRWSRASSTAGCSPRSATRTGGSSAAIWRRTSACSASGWRTC